MWLGLTLDSWNNLIVAFGLLSGFFVLLTGGATFIAFELQKSEAATAAAAFETYKIDSAHDRDVKIGKAEASAKADANVKITQARTDAAAKIREASNTAQLEIEKTKAEAAKANKATEELRKANLDFAAAVSPRVLEQGATSAALKAYAGTPVLVISPADFEPRSAAGQVRAMLAMAEWKIIRGDLAIPPAFFPGIVVQGPVAGASDAVQKAQRVVTDLVKVLNAAGLEARAGAPTFDIGDSGIVVVVGPKPLPKALQINPDAVPADEHGNKIWGNILE